MSDENKKTVLVVDDNELNIKLFRCILQLTDYNMLEAMDAATGIEMAKTNHPDLILMDIQLPDMNGIVATKIIREDEILADTPVLAISGNINMTEETKSCFNEYIFKPFNVKDLIDKIDSYLKG